MSILITEPAEIGTDYSVLFAPDTTVVILARSGTRFTGPPGLVRARVRLQLASPDAADALPDLIALAVRRPVRWGDDISMSLLLSSCAVSGRCVRGLQLDKLFAGPADAITNRVELGDPIAFIDEPVRAVFDSGHPKPKIGHRDVAYVVKSMPWHQLLGAGGVKLFVAPPAGRRRDALVTRVIALPVALVANTTAYLLPMYCVFVRGSDQYFDVFVGQRQNIAGFVNATAWKPTAASRGEQLRDILVDLFFGPSVQHAAAARAPIANALTGVLDDDMLGADCPVAAKVALCPKGHTVSLVTVLRQHNSLPKLLKYLVASAGAVAAGVADVPDAVDKALAMLSPMMLHLFGLPAYASCETNSYEEHKNASLYADCSLKAQTTIHAERARNAVQAVKEEKMIEQQRALAELLDFAVEPTGPMYASAIAAAAEAQNALLAATSAAAALSALEAFN